MTTTTNRAAHEVVDFAPGTRIETANGFLAILDAYDDKDNRGVVIETREGAVFYENSQIVRIRWDA